MEDAVARLQRIKRIDLNAVHKERICVVQTIAPQRAFVHTSMYINDGVIRLGDRQIQRVESTDLTVAIEYRVIINTGVV